MARYTRFTFLCDDNERKMVAAIADRLQRTQSDAIRWLVINAAEQMGVRSNDGANIEGDRDEPESAAA